MAGLFWFQRSLSHILVLRQQPGLGDDERLLALEPRERGEGRVTHARVAIAHQEPESTRAAVGG